MAKFGVILAAAGRSRRFGDPMRKKPFVDLQGQAVWLRALGPFTSHPDVSQIVIVVSPDDLDEFKERFRPNLAFLDVQVVAGGAERADSVQNGLAALEDEIEYVAVHDAARPLIVKELVESVFQAAQKHQAAIPASPIRGTIKRVTSSLIEETVPRDGLWEAQTPQVFERSLLEQAFAKRNGEAFTDEAQLVESQGHPVAVVDVSPINMKITTQDDLKMAQALLGALPKGKGIRSIHPFADERPDLFS